MTNTVTVTGTLGPAAAGASVVFAPVGFTGGVFTDQGGLLQVEAAAPAPVSTQCDDTGAFSVDLTATDNPGARSDTGCSTNATTTVTDSFAADGDINQAISGPGIPSSTTITAVVVGVGYTISNAATATASGLTFIVGDAGPLPQSWTWGITVTATAYSPVQPGLVLFSAKTFPVAHANGSAQDMGILVPPPSPFAAASLAAEIRRAEAAEALLAPLASPSFTGTPTAPTAAALAGGVQIATNAYADASAAAAVATELSRAETAEALALPLAGGTMSGVLAAAAGLQYNPAGVAATLVTAGTITPVAGVVTLPVTMAAAVTGIIIAPGTADGQVCNIINTSAFTLTFAVAGTSNVADGAGDVIAALSYAAFLWDATTSLWYRGW